VSGGRFFPKPRELVSIICTFLLICLGWVFFRSPSIAISIDYIWSFFYGLFKTGLLEYSPSILIHFLPKELLPVFISSLISINFLLIIEWLGRDIDNVIDFKLGTAKAFIFNNIILFMILFLGQFDNNEFIYFQF
jgi:alginate O-acetyltransferase complex protein AlgI